MLTIETKDKIQKRVNDLTQKANQIWNRTFNAPKIFFDVVGTRGGYQKGNEIHFNPGLLIDNLEHFIHQTVGHEFAHYLQDILYPDFNLRRHVGYRNGKPLYRRAMRPHGNEWKHIMYRLGLTPDRCHSYDTTNVKARHFTKYNVYCLCATPHQVTLKLVNKMKKGRTYTCRKCKHQIAFKKEDVKPRTPLLMLMEVMS